jgi:hypothetical protein
MLMADNTAFKELFEAALSITIEGSVKPEADQAVPWQISGDRRGADYPI